MADFDPKTDVLNNAINEPGWTILDVRNADELDQGIFLRAGINFDLF